MIIRFSRKTTNMTDRKPHHGRNIKRIREIQGIKQEALALELGEDWNQKKISLLESKENIDSDLLNQVAKALRIPPEAIENYDEEKTINIFSNTYHDNSSILGTYNFNPIEKWVEALEENKRLYEALLKEKDEKIKLLEVLTTKK